MKLAKPQETKSTICFSAELFQPKATEKNGSWTLLTLLQERECEASFTRARLSLRELSTASLFGPLSNQTAKEVTLLGSTKPYAMPQARML